jgi:hypothetical protein
MAAGTLTSAPSAGVESRRECGTGHGCRGSPKPTLGLWLSCIDSDRNARRAGGNRPPVFGSLGIPVVSRPIQQRCHVGENVL